MLAFLADSRLELLDDNVHGLDHDGAVLLLQVDIEMVADGQRLSWTRNGKKREKYSDKCMTIHIFMYTYMHKGTN